MHTPLRFGSRSTADALIAGALTCFLAVCTGSSDAHGRGQPAEAAARAAAPPPGSIRIGDTTYEFRITRCDLRDTAGNGMLVQGAGKLPDGRMLLVEVERLTPDHGGPGWIAERATVQFGSFMEKDGWEATAMSRNGTTWHDGNGQRTLDGPIIRITGNDLAVEGLYRHSSRDASRSGVLQVSCPPATAGK